MKLNSVTGYLFVMLAFQFRAQQYSFHNYSVKEGVAQSQVYSLLQDSRGFLWMGTRGGGITRFDGVNFKTLTVKDGLVNNYVFDIKEGPDGNLWIGTNQGLSVYNGIKFKNYIPPGDSSQVWIQKIDFDKKGRAWLATNYGLLLFDTTETFTNISARLKQKNTLINTLLVDGENIWAGTSVGLYKISEWRQVYTVEKYAHMPVFNNNSVTTIKKDRQGNLWIGTYGDGVYLLKGKKFTRIDTAGEIKKQTILDIYFDEEQVWLATLQRGVGQYHIAAKTFNWLGEAEGLSNNHVRSIIKDKSGNYWFGTSGGGVCNYFGKQFTHFDKSSGLGGNFIYSIFRDSRNRLWIGTSDKGLTLQDSSRFYLYDAQNGFANVKVKAIGEDKTGLLYFGTDGQGMFTYDGKEFTALEEFNRKYIRAIVRDSSGRLWIATAGSGLYRLTPGETNYQLHRMSIADGLLNDRLTCLHCDKRQRIWYGTENHGLGRVENDSVLIKLPGVKQGLSSGSIRCLAEDTRGQLWVGTAGYGVCSIKLYDDKNEMNCLDHNQGLTSNNVYLLAGDNRGNLFVGTETGLDYLVFDSEPRLTEIKHYSKGEGFTGIETCQNSVYKEPTGTIWFGTINGLSKYNPDNHTRNQNEPVTTITDIKLFYESIANTAYANFAGDWNQIKELELPHDQNRITFDFMAINFSNPEAVKYQWKLEGFDKTWSPVSKDRSISYSNLGAGTYVFYLKACNEDGVWNKKPVTYRFRIMPPVWLRWWFIAACALLLLGLITALFRWRISRVKTKAKEEQDKLQLEKEIVELEQKALRLQMNPHFIFNALNSIQSQISANNEQQARYYLAKFSRLMRQILDNSRNPVITLEEEINTLENYLLIEKFCNDGRFDYTILVDENLEKDFIRLPPMLLQPFIENSIKHGLKHKQGQRGNIEVSFSEKNGLLECSVTDNGIGRKKSEELNSHSRETYHKSTALLVTRERLELLTDIPGNNMLEIVDLYAANGLACGTKVIVRLPLN